MRIDIDEPHGRTARYALASANLHERTVSALRLDGRTPTTFVADEVVVDAADRDLIDRMLAHGGRIVRDVYDPDPPAEFRDAGLGRETPVDLAGLPRSVRIQFERVPEARDVDLEAYLSRAGLPAERLTFSDDTAAALTRLIAPMVTDGRGIWLNEIGTDATLPLHEPHEGPYLAFDIDPFKWNSMTGRTRVAAAWQLIESMRIARSVSPVVFICIVDSGFWFDAPQAPPDSAGAQTFADIGAGGPQWNAVSDSQGIPTGPGRTNYHGTSVAGVAGAVVGNKKAAAGSGGTVAHLCFFYDDRTADSAKTAMIRCAQWGIPIVNYSGTFTSIELFFGTSAWNDTFNWAADNGTIMFAAAGNDNISLPDDAVKRPASRTPRALTIGALNDDGTKAGFSNYGSSVDLWAPGVNIPLVPNPGAMDGKPLSGTSFSAPLTAGVAAMVRAANPNLTMDQVRDTLVNTGWDGAGPGGKGLDAYAAVWAAMAGRFAEDVFEKPQETLFPHADGTFKPIFNEAINRNGDRDTFLINVSAFSTIQVDLQWYERLANVTLAIEATDPASMADPDSTVVSTGAGAALLTAAVGSGQYRIVVTGNGPTAYLLTGRLTPGHLDPDWFEGNDSFDTATQLRFVRNPIPDLHHRSKHGPGSFNLTLHTSGTGPGTTDVDYFTFTVPTDIGALNIPQIIVHSDEQVDVTAYDAARQQIFSKHDRDVTLSWKPGETCYLRVSGSTHTRYSLYVGLTLNDEALHKNWPEVQILPHWWEGPHPDWVKGETYRGIILNEDVLSDGQLVIGEATTGVLPASVRVELLDDAGNIAAESVDTAGRRTFDVAGLEQGAYVLRITSGEQAPVAITVQAPLG
ncbi:S8 family peptidase [Actinocrispum wychmicini]|uniref:Subtilase family protein n=1 Tax=Actinocrispum wychmicini TaxID=1213861 RepID=A0A4R2JPI4_9PSEU|nr:S8/S53 family peptidase [Actinocrispum wychmicini]TCO62073.1 subtilase family protein [Actinocrispum wychmicini]